MWRLLAVLVAVLTLGCSRYETRTTDGLTLRIDKWTGKTERLSMGRWVAIGEPYKVGSSAPLKEDRRGQPCKTPRNNHSWVDQALEVSETGCTPNR
jgi:hypothetical protein